MKKLFASVALAFSAQAAPVESPSASVKGSDLRVAFDALHTEGSHESICHVQFDRRKVNDAGEVAYEPLSHSASDNVTCSVNGQTATVGTDPDVETALPYAPGQNYDFILTRAGGETYRGSVAMPRGEVSFSTPADGTSYRSGEAAYFEWNLLDDAEGRFSFFMMNATCVKDDEKEWLDTSIQLFDGATSDCPEDTWGLVIAGSANISRPEHEDGPALLFNALALDTLNFKVLPAPGEAPGHILTEAQRRGYVRRAVRKWHNSL